MVDAVICDENLSFAMNKQAPEDTVGSSSEICIGFRKDDTDLHDRVQKVFDEMIKDGTAKKFPRNSFKQI